MSTNPSQAYRVLGIGIGLMVAILGLLSFKDYEWSVWLLENRWKAFAEIMRRTFTEDGMVGGSDPIVVFVLLSLGGYLASYQQSASEKLIKYRPVLGYLVSVSLLSGVILVHFIKWGSGRARPHGVLKQGLPYTEWYEPGQHLLHDWIAYSSFPSGHTAAAALLLLLTYVFWNLSSHWSGKAVAVLWGAASGSYAIAMAVARVMAKAHWLTDGIAAIMIVLLAAHLFYFYILDVPTQQLQFEQHGRHANVPSYWELRLVAKLSGMLLGIAILMIHLRALWFGGTPWHYGLGVLGIGMCWFFGKHLQQK